MQSTVSFRNSALFIIILAIAAMRIPNAAQLTIWSNFSPIGAMAIFGGATFAQRWKAIMFPLATLLVSDLLINTLVFHGRFGIMYGGWYWIYGAFALLVLVGRFVVKNITAGNVLLAAVAGSLLHWLLADFSVWMSGGTDLRTMQPLARNWQGLMQCYLQGLPYFKNFLLGTTVYSCIMFGMLVWLKQHRSAWVLQQA